KIDIHNADIALPGIGKRKQELVGNISCSVGRYYFPGMYLLFPAYHILSGMRGDIFHRNSIDKIPKRAQQNARSLPHHNLAVGFFRCWSQFQSQESAVPDLPTS